MFLLFEKGFNPYLDNTEFLSLLYEKKEGDKEPIDEAAKVSIPNPSIKVQWIADEENRVIKESFALATKIKESVLSKTSFPSFNNNVKRFKVEKY